MSNRMDPDETAHYDLCCLQKPIIIACGSERVKIMIGGGYFMGITILCTGHFTSRVEVIILILGVIK